MSCTGCLTPQEEKQYRDGGNAGDRKRELTSWLWHQMRTSGIIVTRAVDSVLRSGINRNIVGQRFREGASKKASPDIFFSSVDDNWKSSAVQRACRAEHM